MGVGRGVIKGDADGFGTNGCLKVTDCGRLPGGREDGRARAEMRERTPGGGGSGMR